MMLKIDFSSVKQIKNNPKGLLITWFVNWIIKPFTMYLIGYLFFFGIYGNFLDSQLASEYLAGAILLGAAPCTAMVFVWSKLTKGDGAYTLVQVATNDLIILIAYVPIVSFLLGIGNITIPWETLVLSVVLFIVAITFFMSYIAKLPYSTAAPCGMIGASNFFELAVAVAISLFGLASGATLATVVGVLVEVPVMLFLVKVANSMQDKFGN